MPYSIGRSSGGSSSEHDSHTFSVTHQGDASTVPSTSFATWTDSSSDFLHPLENGRPRRTSEIRRPSSLSFLSPMKRRSNDLSDLTIDKLNFKSLGIYGREREIGMLKSYANSLAEASSERRLVLISGTSGCGKTKLADTLQARIRRRGGLYVEGKFDLNATNEPYLGITGAFAEFCRSIVKLKKRDIAKAESICSEIERSLGSELSLLAQVIPMIDEVITSDKKVERPMKTLTSASSGDSKNRMHFAFLRFTRVVAIYFQPLIMVLDDLQWADAASLDLLEVLLSDRVNPKLMLVGLYRSNEVGETHIAHRILQDLETKSLDGTFLLSRIEITDLDIEAVHGIIQEVLRCQGDSRTFGLAKTCLEKTNGNPFFLVHYLKMLYDKKLLQFNLGTLSWTWDDAEIRSNTDASDNVVELLKGKMRMLPPAHLRILKLASCLGSIFEVDTLRVLWQKSDDQEATDASKRNAEFDASLKQLEAEGLIVRVSKTPLRQKWVHDRIHEAAIDLIPEGHFANWRRSVGEILLSELDEENLDTSIFVVVNLLNSSSREDWDLATRLKLARLNCDASLKAVQVSAFESAAVYAATGIDMLPDNAWVEHYRLTLQLYSIGAKAEGSIGNVATMERYCRAVLSREDKPLEDKFDVYHTWVDSILNLQKAQEAADLLLDVLGKFKCRFPKSPVGIGMSMLGNVARIKATMKSRDPSKLSSMKDSTRVELMRFLDKLSTCLYVLKDARMPLVIFRSLNWTVKYGVCDQSPAAFATTGMMLTGILDDIQGGSRYGQHAIDLLKETTSNTTAARTTYCSHCFLFPWTQSYRNQIKPLLQSYHVGLQTGDTESALGSIFAYVVLQFFSGIDLHTIETDLSVYLQQMADLKRGQVLKLAKSWWQMILNLLGRDNAEDPTNFTGEAMSAEDLKQSLSETFWHASVLVCQGTLLTYFGQHSRQVNVLLQDGHDCTSKVLVASPVNVYHYFLSGLSCFAMARQTGKRKYAKLGQVCRAKVKRWLDMGNPNAKHYDSLLDAEHMALKGRKYLAIKQFEVAILLAARGGYQQDAALASERLGEFQIEVMHDNDEGSYRIGEAIKYWKGWGAFAKVKQLETKHLLNHISCPSCSTIDM